jgi:prepilin-type N-terminal cleavage/methylation domain-containing protein
MKKGFTLIELLIVIGILAILATTVVLILNPNELLKQARDAQRISDFKSIKSAISLYLVRTTTPTLNPGNCELGFSGTSHTWRASQWTNNPISIPTGGQPFTNPSPVLASASISSTVIRNVDGQGWVSVPLNTIGNPPLSNLPIDPNPYVQGIAYLSTIGRFYAFQCKGTQYELNASMESIKYAFGGDKDVESTDGGTSARQGVTINQAMADNIYEVGNAPGFAL